VFRNSIATNGP